MAGDRAGLSPGLGVERVRDWLGEGFRATWYGPPSAAVEVGRETGVLPSLASSAITGVLPWTPDWFRIFKADAAELGTRLIIGLIPDVLLVLLLDTDESESFETGVGGTERCSSVRVNAWSTTERKPGSWACSAGVFDSDP
jgi:hypothetical protein